MSGAVSTSSFRVGLALSVVCAACGHDPASPPDASLGGASVVDAPSPRGGGRPSSGLSGLSVLQFHESGSRDGVYVDPAMTKAAAGAIHRDAAFSATVAGQVYAQPLWVERGPGGKEAFVVATESNHVTAIDAIGAAFWDATFGRAASGGLPCGNIARNGATLGITGTPVIDLASRTIYFDAMTDTGGGTDRHEIHAISLDDGSERSGWPIDVSSAVPGFDSPHQNQRGALSLVSGVLYVPYGGHYGDCMPYYGWVVGVNVADPASVKTWRAAGPPTWKTSPPVGAAGIWAAGGLATDGTYLYASTGNSMNGGFASPPSWVGGNAVFRLARGPSFTLRPSNYYYPSNWAAMDDADLDLGGANPVVFDMPGAPFPHLVAALGKDGKLYLLDRDDLGGRGGALSVTRVSDGQINGGAAVYTTSQGTYVAFRAFGGAHGCAGGGNLGVARIRPGTPPTASVVWCSKGTTDLGSPIVTTTDGTSNVVVWDANDRLYGYDGDTGALVFDGAATSSDALPAAMHYFAAPIDAKGRIVVATCGNCGRGRGNGTLAVFE